MADYLGGRSARGDQLVSKAPERRVGLLRIVLGIVPFRSAICDFAIASLQARCHPFGMAGGVVDADALCRSGVAGGTELLANHHRDMGRHCASNRDGRLVAGVFLPQPEFDATAADLRPGCTRSTGTGT